MLEFVSQILGRYENIEQLQHLAIMVIALPLLKKKILFYQTDFTIASNTCREGIPDKSSQGQKFPYDFCRGGQKFHQLNTTYLINLTPYIKQYIK